MATVHVNEDELKLLAMFRWQRGLTQMYHQHQQQNYLASNVGPYLKMSPRDHASNSSGCSSAGSPPLPADDSNLDITHVIRSSYTSGNGGLAEELERLFIDTPRERLGSASTSGSFDIETDFHRNGTDADLDYLDRLSCSQQAADFKIKRPTRAEELMEAHSQAREALLMVLARSQQKKIAGNKKNVCVFCKTNGENEMIYSSHVLKEKNGRVCCPILRAYKCPNCGASGDTAHTLKYCPLSAENQRKLRRPPPPPFSIY